jgi:transcriptional regulator with XRE-family HTH domain
MIETRSDLPKIVETKSNEEKQTPTSSSLKNSLLRRLERGVEARAQFVDSHINKGVAYQLRAMREGREWSQAQLAQVVDMPQTAISRLESSKYGKHTITTLKRMAKVYDVGLEVRFVPFSKLLNRISGTPFIEQGITSDALDVPSFEEEQEAGDFDAASDFSLPVTSTQAVIADAVQVESKRVSFYLGVTVGANPVGTVLTMQARGDISTGNTLNIPNREIWSKKSDEMSIRILEMGPKGSTQTAVLN